VIFVTEERDTRICSPAWRGSRTNGPVSVDSDGRYRSIQNDAEREQTLLAFIGHFSKSFAGFPIEDQTAETCERVYATQIFSHNGTGTQFITDQIAAFMSSYFQETCKVLGIRRMLTNSYHPASNGMLERWYKDLHTALSHYINAANTKWDTIAPFFLMAHRSQPHSVTGYSPFYLIGLNRIRLLGTVRSI